MLHITDGESVAGTLRTSGVPGEVSIYGDLLYEGPAPAGVSAEVWRESRARFLAASVGFSLDEARRYLAACDQTLAAMASHDETVLWIDHRLTGQLILLKVLDRFSGHSHGGALSLICRGQYSGVEPFVGLGQLTPDQLASLADTRQRVTDEQFHLARTAWSAFTSPDPAGIERVIGTDTSALPFLAAALRRHLEQFPSVENGLSRTEQQALRVLGEQGPLPAQRLFIAVQATESPHFMGDGSFYRLLAELASAPHPLVRLQDPPKPGRGRQLATLTDTGSRVLQGRDDHVRLNGIDRWLGGVYLKGPVAAWRWEGASGRLVRSSG